MAHDKRKLVTTMPRAAAHAAALPPARFNHSTCRRVLATGVAVAALFAHSGHPAHAQGVPPPSCAVSPVDGSVVNCTGDQSAGITLNDGTGPFRTLNVFDLTTNIAPASGVEGVHFTSNGDIALNVNTGPFAVITTGDNADGIYALSSGGAVTITSIGDIATDGALSFGINASGDGPITITSVGNIATYGEASFGIIAQSTNGPLVINSIGRIATTGNGAIAIAAMSGGDVTVNWAGSITVAGEGPSMGFIPGAITAMSQGGNSTINSFGNIYAGGDFLSGISAVAGGDARVIAAGRIATDGEEGAGINAQGTSVFVESHAGITTTGFMAPGIGALGMDAVHVVSHGPVTTTGDDSDGVIAGSMSGRVVVEAWGSISATGDGSAAIRTTGYAGNVIRNYGTALGGLCACSAGVDMLSIDDGALNRLENYGSIAALSGLAIISEVDGLNATNEVENYGVVTGDVVLTDGTDAVGTFVNHAGALFNAGDVVTAELVRNDGILAPGGRGIIQMTGLGDSLTQTASGVYAVDVDGVTNTSDSIEVSDFADLAGKVAVTLTSLPTTAVQSYLILEALGGVTDTGLGLIASPALHATLFTDATNVMLGIAVDFTVDSLNPNQRAIAANLDQIFVGGVGTLGPAFLGLLNVGSIDEFKNALNQLSPEIYSDAEIAALYSSLAFSNSLLSCKVNGTDTASIIREGQCLWAGASARFLDSGTTSDQIGFNETAGLFTAGAQVALDDVWRLGAAAGYQSSTLQTATGAQSEGSLAQAGVSLKYNPGPLLLAGALTGGGAWYDTTRPMAFGGFTGLAEGKQDLGIFSATFRAAYVLGTPHLYFKPILDANVTHLELGGFTESGGNGAALTVDGAGHTVFSLAPTLEAGTEWWLGNGTLVRPLIRAGAIWYEGADFATTASFAGAPLGVSPFTINTDIDEVMGLIGAGVEVINGSDAVLRLSYDGQLGADTQIHSVGIKGSSKF